MIKFLAKGLFRDPSRSVFPILTVMAGTMLTVLMFSWMQGVFSQLVDVTARLSTGHVKVMTRAYAEIADQVPNDLAILDVQAQLDKLRREYPNMRWVSRIRFGGLLDIPDAHGETRAQAPVMGLGIDLLDENSPETELLNLKSALTAGRMPQQPDEILMSDTLAKKLGVTVGEKATLLGSTMGGSMSMYNFTVAGTVHLGITLMDRSLIVADIRGVQSALDMTDGASEILGFMATMVFDDTAMESLKQEFNAKYANESDEFSPFMKSLREQQGLGQLLDMGKIAYSTIIFVFIFAMSLVLWNAGLLGGLRRYGEIGLRLAIGEPKGALYQTLILESVLVGLVGSVFGTAIGLRISLYLQHVGFDVSGMMSDSTMLFPDVIRARVTIGSYFFSFIPGLFAPVLGSAFAGIGVYRRQTAQLFKELEV